MPGDCLDIVTPNFMHPMPSKSPTVATLKPVKPVKKMDRTANAEKKSALICIYKSMSRDLCTE
jgi:hypothetical protein